MIIGNSLQFIRLSTDETVTLSPCVATIGNFDGVHIGHQRILEKVIAKAKVSQLIPTVITFEPCPQRFLQPERAPQRLMSISQKIMTLSALGIQRLICLRFNQTLSKVPAMHFIEHYLVKKMNVAHIVIGEDFRFGYRQEGNIETLQEGSIRFGFSCEIININDKKISSTLIRQAVCIGDLIKVQRMLGQHYQITHRVVHGQGRGRTIGIPTANLPIPKDKLRFSGVFVVNAFVDGKQYDGVANVGVRPTVGGDVPTLEVHLFNFSGYLYGKRMTVTFLHKLRDENKFPSLEKLVQQIQRDIHHANEYLTEKKKQAELT